MPNYWTDQHTQSLSEYISTSNHEQRNRIIDKTLYPAMAELSRRALTSCGVMPTDELVQDIVIHLQYKSFEKITEDKINGALQYLWTSARNYIMTYVIKRKERYYITIDQLLGMSSNETSDRDDDADNDYAYQAHGNHMILELSDDDKIKIRRAAGLKIFNMVKNANILNATNSVFAKVLLDYLESTDYDPTGFGRHAREKMHLSLGHFRAICGRLKLKTYDFNQEFDYVPYVGYKIVAINKDGEVAGRFDCINQAAQEIGANKGHISSCLSGRLHSHMGYTWKKVDYIRGIETFKHSPLVSHRRKKGEKKLRYETKILLNKTSKDKLDSLRKNHRVNVSEYLRTQIDILYDKFRG